MYGSKNWTLNGTEMKKPEPEKMHHLRRVPIYALTDHVCNTAIHNRLQIYSLEE
jgi:hypothetical protein